MSGLGCPYVAGPQCRDCDGSCRRAVPPLQPEPCQACSMLPGGLVECEGLCAEIHTREDFDRVAAELAARDCPRHPGEWADNCRGCAADRLGGSA